MIARLRKFADNPSAQACAVIFALYAMMGMTELVLALIGYGANFPN
jgi:hypothetical protein